MTVRLPLRASGVLRSPAAAVRANNPAPVLKPWRLPQDEYQLLRTLFFSNDPTPAERAIRKLRVSDSHGWNPPQILSGLSLTPSKDVDPKLKSQLEALPLKSSADINKLVNYICSLDSPAIQSQAVLHVVSSLTPSVGLAAQFLAGYWEIALMNSNAVSTSTAGASRTGVRRPSSFRITPAVAKSQYLSFLQFAVENASSSASSSVSPSLSSPSYVLQSLKQLHSAYLSLFPAMMDDRSVCSAWLSVLCIYAPISELRLLLNDLYIRHVVPTPAAVDVYVSRVLESQVLPQFEQEYKEGRDSNGTAQFVREHMSAYILDFPPHSLIFGHDLTVKALEFMLNWVCVSSDQVYGVLQLVDRRSSLANRIKIYSDCQIPILQAVIRASSSSTSSSPANTLAILFGTLMRFENMCPHGLKDVKSQTLEWCIVKSAEHGNIQAIRRLVALAEQINISTAEGLKDKNAALLSAQCLETLFQLFPLTTNKNYTFQDQLQLLSQFDKLIDNSTTRLAFDNAKQRLM